MRRGGKGRWNGLAEMVGWRRSGKSHIMHLARRPRDTFCLLVCTRAQEVRLRELQKLKVGFFCKLTFPLYSSLVLGLFVLLVLYHGRQVEIASSLDFLWKQQARRELEEMSEMRRHTDQLLHNILPAHVARYFLENERQAEVRI